MTTCKKGIPLHQTFIAASMSAMLSDSILRGISGGNFNFDLTDSLLASIQSGVSYVSYNVAVDLLSNSFEKFKKIRDDPKSNLSDKVALCVIGGATAAALTTAVNYPIQCYRNKRNNTNQSDLVFSLKGAEKWYMDRVFAYVGFAISMDRIIPTLSPPVNSIHKWAQTHYLLQMSHLNGVLLSYPYQWINHKTPFGKYLKEHMKSIGRRVICSDFSCYFKRTFAGLPYI